MKLGFLTNSIDDITKAAKLGFDGLELHSSAFGNAAEGPLDGNLIAKARDLCDETGVTITALAYYDIAFRTPDPDKIADAYDRVFDAATELGIDVIASMSGFDPDRNWKGNIELFAERFGPVAERAEAKGKRIAFENWMGFGGQLPFRPMNMGGSPATWDAWFEAVPSLALGIEFDPSHLAWQGIDYLRALREYQSRVYHVHAKDSEPLPEGRYRHGVNGPNYRFRIPGYGEINWTGFITALDEYGYTGGVAIEHEDEIYGWHTGGDLFDEGLVRGWQVLNPLIHPTSKPLVKS